MAGLRHYIDRIDINRTATAALTASATPVLVTTTNLPGSLTLTFGADAGGVGVDKMQTLDFGSSGLSASAASSSSSIVCPAYAGVIWRVNVIYRFGL
jgi:spore coat protein U-like protein